MKTKLITIVIVVSFLSIAGRSRSGAAGDGNFYCSNLKVGTANFPTSAGTSGFVFQSNGTNWISAIKPAGTGSFIGTRFLTSGTTYTPTSGTNTVTLYLQGGGGSGGNVTAAGAGKSAAASGGSVGGFGIVTFSGVSGTYAYAIGGAGGATTFTNGATVYGAGGGRSGNSMTAAATLQVVTAGSTTTATNCDVNAGSTAIGAPGITITAVLGSSGFGASSSWGGGGAARVNSSGNGNAATGYGAAGGGAFSSDNASYTGGAGSQGAILIYEYK